MKGVDLYARVRRAVYVEGMSQRGAARYFGIDPRTVAKMMQFSVPPGYGRSRPPARPKLDPFTKIIDQILDDDGSMPTKQRHTAKRIFERLRDEHGYRAARRTSLRRSKVGGSSPSSRLGTAAWNGSTACPQSGDPNGCTAICPLMRPTARAYPHQGHGPRADPTGRIHISDFRTPAPFSLANSRRVDATWVVRDCRKPIGSHRSVRDKAVDLTSCANSPTPT